MLPENFSKSIGNLNEKSKKAIELYFFPVTFVRTGIKMMYSCSLDVLLFIVIIIKGLLKAS